MSHFLQSKEWEKFQKSLGRKTFRVGDVLAIKLPLAFGKSYLYSAGSEAPPTTEKIKVIARQEGAVFFKYEPLCAEFNSAHLRNAGFRKSSKEVQPQKTIVLDLTKSEDELFADMRQKTRYNIRLASRDEGMKHVIYSIGDKGFDSASNSFLGLIKATAERDKFSTHPDSYYEKLLRNFSSPYTIYHIPYTRLMAVVYKGEVISSSIVLFHENAAYYLHGASDYRRRELMAPYLLHWGAILHAKEKGFLKYDFWGADEKRWPGVTRFKRGWGGDEIEYIGSYDYVFQPAWYGLYNLRQYLKK